MDDAILFPLIFVFLGLGDLIAGLWVMRQGQPSPADNPQNAMETPERPPRIYFVGKGLALGGGLTAAAAVVVLFAGRDLASSRRLLVLVLATVACMALSLGWQLVRSQRDETHRTDHGISPD